MLYCIGVLTFSDIYISTVSVVILWLTRKYCDGGWCYSKARLDGKTVIVTGANTGIGKETAKDLAKRGTYSLLQCE